MKIVAVILFLVSAGAVQASGVNLQEMFAKWETKYSEMGQDNNYLIYASIDEGSYPLTLSKIVQMIVNHNQTLDDSVQQRKLIKLEDSKSVINTLSRCVFQTRGAYGDHISKSDSLKISKAVYFRDLKALKANFYKAEIIINGDLWMFDEECTLIVENGSEVWAVNAGVID